MKYNLQLFSTVFISLVFACVASFGNLTSNPETSSELLACEKKTKVSIQKNSGCLPKERAWLDKFIETRFEKFGDYEDAIDTRSDFLFHSGISLFLNCGLLTPEEILDKILPLEKTIPINSFEGFIRQIIGWREFIRGIYQNYGEIQEEKNFFNHERKLKINWYNSTTGIAPLDNAILQVNKLSYTHHINQVTF